MILYQKLVFIQRNLGNVYEGLEGSLILFLIRINESSNGEKNPSEEGIIRS